MAIYSIGQIQSLMRSTGWPENIIVLMAAVAMAESSGRTDAIGTISPNEYSVGLFQINTFAHRNFSVQQLKDPYTNAREGLRIYGVQGLRAWGSFTDGRYRRYMADSQRVYGQPAAQGIAPGTLPAMFPSTQGAFDFLSENSGGITTGAIAVFLIGLGIIIFLRR